MYGGSRSGIAVHSENLKLQENFVKTVIKETVQNSFQDLKVLERDPAPLLAYLEKDFPMIDYTKVLEILQSKGEDIVLGDDINSEREQMLTAEFGRSGFYPKIPKRGKSILYEGQPRRS